MKQKFSIAMSLAVILAMLLTSLALADDVSNNLDTSVDTVAEQMALTVSGANGFTDLYTVNQNGDGKNGCNLTGATTLVVDVVNSDPTVATVSPSQLTFTNCETEGSKASTGLTVIPVSAGSTTISLSLVSNSSSGTFNLAPATFTVNVTAPTPMNTPPSIVVAGVTGGASYSKDDVPAATCDVTDAEDGNSSFAAILSAITGPYASDGIGEQTASCSYTDGGGLTAEASVTYGIVDPSAPEIGYVLSPDSPDGSNNWYKSDVDLTWTVTENESPNSLAKTGCVDQSITADQADTAYSCSATSAGGSTGPVSVSIKRDATAPTISGSASPTANGFGWNNTDVTVSFVCADNLSGVASCGPATTLAGEGAGQLVDGTAVDNAGNSADTAVSDINIDKTDPSVSLVGGPADGASYYFGSVPAAPTCSASDGLSGLNGDCSVLGYDTSVGTHTVTASATDKADNLASASATYTVLAWTLKGFYAPVDMNGVFNVVKNGSTVPLKFEVFAASELTSTSVVKSFTVTKITCDSSAAIDDIELVTAGATSLRYDGTAGQFIQNWQTPKIAGACYKVTMTTQDGSSLSAFFKLK